MTDWLAFHAYASRVWASTLADTLLNPNGSLSLATWHPQSCGELVGPVNGRVSPLPPILSSSALVRSCLGEAELVDALSKAASLETKTHTRPIKWVLGIPRTKELTTILQKIRSLTPRYPSNWESTYQFLRTTYTPPLLQPHCSKPTPKPSAPQQDTNVINR